jgi:hypothetical protein
MVRKLSDDIVVGEAHARAAECVAPLSSEHNEQGADAMTTLADYLETLTLCRVHLPAGTDPIHRERLDAIAVQLREREQELAEKEARLLAAEEQFDRLSDDYTALLRALAQAVSLAGWAVGRRGVYDGAGGGRRGGA